jgi:hypothetical protein
MITTGIGAILILLCNGAREIDLMLPMKNGCMSLGARTEHLLKIGMYVLKNRTIFIPTASAHVQQGL